MPIFRKYLFVKTLAAAVLLSGGFLFLPGTGVLQAQDAPSDMSREILQRETIRRQELLLAATKKLDEAQNLIAVGKMDEAREKVAEVTKDLPNSGEGAPVYAKASQILSELDSAKAAEAFKNKDYFGARDAASLALSENPKNAEASKIISDSNEVLGIKSGEDKPANPAIDRKFISNLNQVQDDIKSGEDLMATGQYAAAEKAFEQALAIDPYNKVAAREIQKLQDKMAAAMEIARKSSNQERKTQTRDQWTERFQIDKNLGSVQTANTVPITKKNEFRLDQKLRTLVIKQVDFNDATIEDAVRFLTDQSRLVDPEGTGINFLIRNEQVKQQGKTFSLKLSNVPVGEVLRYITNLAGVRYRLEEFAVFIVPLSDRNETLVTREFPVRATFFDTENSEGGDNTDANAGGGRRRVAVTTVDSDTAGAAGAGDQVRKALEARGVQFSEGATAIYSRATGILTVRNTQDQIDLIEELVTENQGETLIVSVQAKLLEVNQTDLDSLAFNWNLANAFFIPGQNYAVGIGALGTNLQGSTAIKPTDGISAFLSSNESASVLANNPGSVVSNPNRFGISGRLSGTQFAALLDALSQKQSTDLLTAPTIVVNDGAQGKITIAREFYYPTEFDAPKVQPVNIVSSNTNGNLTVIGTTPTAPIVIPAWPTQFESRNVGVVLTVQPRVTPDHQRVYLVIKPDVTEFDGFINYGSPMFSTVDGQAHAVDPITDSLGVSHGALINNNVINQPVFSTRTVENAQMEIQDGYTMVLGGLIREDISTVNDKVPILGDIPLFGRLFRSKAEQAIKKNMLIFVTVRILRPDGEPFNQTAGLKNPAKS
ncbi:MAG: hypothetical protein PHD76_08535 [Methylacidiphilales bacterium]|nr:hypothetical protein [Candidatus Methylacidiphilales bacterium]